MKRKTQIILAAGSTALAVYGAYAIITGQKEYSWPTIGVCAGLAVLFAWRAARKGKKPAEEPTRDSQIRAERPIEQPQKKEYATWYHGAVSGVTFQGRQRILARIKKKQDEGEEIRFDLEEGEYKGEPSIKVLAGTWEDDELKQIGFIPAKSVEYVLPHLSEALVTGEIYGGPEYEGEENPKNYGCAIDVYSEI